MMFLGYGTKHDTILVYDQSVPVSYGLWVCRGCKSRFYGGGHAIHDKDCPKRSTGYDGLEYHFGDKQIEEAKRTARKWGEDHSWYGISVALLKEKMPHLLV